MPDTVDASAALQSALKVAAALSAQLYSRLVVSGVMSREQAADALAEDAALVEAMRLPAPLIGEVFAEDLRGYAKAVAGGDPDGPSPANLTLVK